MSVYLHTQHHVLTTKMKLSHYSVTAAKLCLYCLCVINLLDNVTAYVPLQLIARRVQPTSCQRRKRSRQPQTSSEAPFDATAIHMLPKRDDDDTAELTLLEKEILSSVQERLDMKSVTEALQEPESDNSRGSRMYYYDVRNPRRDGRQSVQPTTPTPQWKIAIASASAASALAFVVSSSNLFVAAVMWVAVFIAANGDPLDEENAAGALARVFGRSTLRAVEASQPKLRALARAVITEQEEIIDLQHRIQRLEKENAELRLWKHRRLQVDEKLPEYTLEELKELARKNELSVGGTKAQLLVRVMEADVIPFVAGRDQRR